MEITIKSSLRTLALFELFSLEQTPLTIKEISDGLGMPQSSTSMLVKSLVELGYLERNHHSRSYYPTLRILLLGTWMRRQHRRAGQLPLLLGETSKKTGFSTVLAMRNGIYSQYLLGHSGREPSRFIVESGQMYPLACSSTGWCLLSYESRANIGKIVRRTISEAKLAHWRETAKLAPERIEESIRQGFAFSRGETHPGLGAIAISLPSVPGAQNVSAAVGGRVELIEEKKELILESLHQLAASVRMLQDEDEPATVAFE